MTRIAIFNQKGGVGKTTSALNLAATLTQTKHQVIAVDMDPQGHLTQIYQGNHAPIQHGLFDFYQDRTPLHTLMLAWEGIGRLIPAKKELIKVDSIFGKGPTILNRLNEGLTQLEAVESKAHIVMDCCPYLGVLSLNCIFAADVVIVPISSDYMSLQAAQKVEQTLKALEPVLKKRVVRRYMLTRYDRRRKMTFEVEEKVRAHFGQEVCTSTISENVALAESPQHHQDVLRYNASSAGAHDYQALLSELLKAKLIGKR